RRGPHRPRGPGAAAPGAGAPRERAEDAQVEAARPGRRPRPLARGARGPRTHHVTIREPPRTPGGPGHTSRGVVLGRPNGAAIRPSCVLPPLGPALGSRTREFPDS